MSREAYDVMSLRSETLCKGSSNAPGSSGDQYCAGFHKERRIRLWYDADQPAHLHNGYFR
jgi:hypothetical protein